MFGCSNHGPGPILSVRSIATYGRPGCRPDGITDYIGLSFWSDIGYLCMMFMPRLTNVLSALILAALLAGSHARGLSILCINDGGHLEVEVIGADCCDRDCPLDATAQAHSFAAGEDGCGSCIDLLIAHDATRASQARSGAAGTTVGSSASGASTHACPALGGQAACGTPAHRPTQAAFIPPQEYSSSVIRC